MILTTHVRDNLFAGEIYVKFSKLICFSNELYSVHDSASKQQNMDFAHA